MNKLRQIIRNIMCEGISKEQAEKIDDNTIIINGRGKSRKAVSAIADGYFGYEKYQIIATELDGIYIATRGKYDESKTENYNRIAHHLYG